jgi:hypothetical protein
MEEWLKHHSGAIVHATPVRTYRIIEVLHLFLLHHGCTLEQVNENEAILTYPPGTTRQELYPRTSDIRYRVMLPDGIELREIDTRRHGGLILLQVVVDERTEPELEKYLEQGAGL